jgi:hypothetical protein
MKSLRQRKKAIAKQQAPKELEKHLHLVAGNHKHSHTHSISPISADEIEKLHHINPQYATRLFDLLQDGLDAEKQEAKSFFDAVEREQANDRLLIESEKKNNNKAMLLSFSAMVILMLCGTGLVYFGYEYIGGAVLTTVIMSVVKSILSKKQTD